MGFGISIGVVPPTSYLVNLWASSGVTSFECSIFMALLIHIELTRSFPLIIVSMRLLQGVVNTTVLIINSDDTPISLDAASKNESDLSLLIS